MFTTYFFVQGDDDLFGSSKKPLTGNRNAPGETQGSGNFFLGEGSSRAPAKPRAKPEVVEVITKDLIRTLK